MKEAFNRRRLFAIDIFTKIQLIKSNSPQGAFYIYPDVSEITDGKVIKGVNSSYDLCNWLLEELNIAFVPGEAFGTLIKQNSMNEIKKSSVFSWLLFDLANTVYAFVIPGLYFSVWLVSEQGWTDQALGFATSGAMVIVALTGPWVGARSDGAQGKKPLLLITTLLCIGSTFLLGTFSISISVFLFIISLIGFNLGSVVYDALLISVSTKENRGRISGLGVAFGYVGSLIGFGVATILQNQGLGYLEIFRSVALLFLIFSLPTFFCKGKKTYFCKVRN